MGKSKKCPNPRPLSRGLPAVCRIFADCQQMPAYRIKFGAGRSGKMILYVYWVP